MKKILLLTGAFFIGGVANAQTTYYASVKMGLGDVTIYQDDTKLEDYFAEFGFESSGLLLEISPAIGIDWAVNPEGWLHFRLEAELGYNYYHENIKLKLDDIRMEIDFNQLFLLANWYANFRIDRFVPYVGVGLGHGWGTLTLNDESDGTEEFIDANGEIYALHFGLGYRYSDITTFDLGARRVYVPAEDDGQYVFDSIRLGARFRI